MKLDADCAGLATEEDPVTPLHYPVHVASPAEQAPCTEGDAVDFSRRFKYIHGALRSAKRHLTSGCNTQSRLFLPLVYLSRAAVLMEDLTERFLGDAGGDRLELCGVFMCTSKLMVVVRCRLEADLGA